MGTWHYICKVYNYHDSRACSYKRSGILSRLADLGVEWYGFGLAVWSCMIYRIPLQITLCGILLIQLNWLALAYIFNLESKC
jgi:hypothetical protein